MNLQEFKDNAHLYFGITRKEFERRIDLKIIDLEILKLQIEQNSREIELEAICERRLSSDCVDQVDKFDFLDESAL